MAERPTHEEHILYLMIELDQALARKTPQWLRNRRTPRDDGWQACWRDYSRSSRGRDGAAVAATCGNLAGCGRKGAPSLLRG